MSTNVRKGGTARRMDETDEDETMKSLKNGEQRRRENKVTEVGYKNHLFASETTAAHA